MRGAWISACALVGWALSASAVTLTSGLDTYLMESQPNTAQGGTPTALWDGVVAGGRNHALLYFPIFQDEGGPLDAGAVMNASDFRAYLRIAVVNQGEGGDFYRLWTGFDDSTTWASYGGGVQPGVNAEASPDLSTSFMDVGTYEIEVTSSVLAWAAAPGSNRGWGVLPQTNNGLEFATFESGNGPELVLSLESYLVSSGPSGAVWKYYDGIGAGDPNYPVDGAGRSWSDPGFDDSSWASGQGQFGYGDGDETTLVVPSGITYLFRTSFEVGERPGDMVLDLLRDDAAIVYLNGVEVIRDHLPAGAIDAATTASGGELENFQSGFELDPALLLPNQTNYLAVEIHNHSGTSNQNSDISFDLALRGLDSLEPTPVPEPSAVLQLLVALLLLGGLCRERARRAHASDQPGRRG
jgi:hypothetical protein